LASLTILLAFTQPGARGTQRVKFGAIADVHNGCVVGPITGTWSGEKRWFSNAPIRMADFAQAMQAQGNIDFCVDLGDIVDFYSSSDHNGELTEITNVLENNWSGEMHYLIGNHEFAIWWTGWAHYEAEISQSPPGMNDYWDRGTLAGYPTSASYSFDKQGIHFVVLSHISYSDYASQRTWLNQNLAATSLPIVVFSHCHLHNGSNNPFARRSDWQEIQAILESYNVLATLQGHMHTIPEGADFLYVISGIPYFNLRGSLLGPPDGSPPTPSDNAYYIFEIEPNAAQINGQPAALITVKGFMVRA
jgi:hypothetical protein